MKALALVLLLAACGGRWDPPDAGVTCQRLQHGCVGYDTKASRACYQVPGDLFGRYVDCQPWGDRGQWVSSCDFCRCAGEVF